MRINIAPSGLIRKPAVVEVELAEVRLDESHWKQSQMIVLKEKNGNRSFPIVIGFFEAQAIYLHLIRIVPPRPFTHDLMLQIVHRLDSQLERILIDELKEDTFHAKLYLRNSKGELYIIDSRPSDAIALAVREGAPLFVNDDIFIKLQNSREEE
jgi:bifunctional DNase/RNase